VENLRTNITLRYFVNRAPHLHSCGDLAILQRVNLRSYWAKFRHGQLLCIYRESNYDIRPQRAAHPHCSV